MPTISKAFPIDAGVFSSASVTINASTDINSSNPSAGLSILNNQPFPAGDIKIGQISVAASTGNVSAPVPDGATVTFDFSVSGQSGVGIYNDPQTAITALSLADTPKLTLPKADPATSYVLMDFGYSASLTASATAPIGVLGSATFGGTASGDCTFALLQAFPATEGAATALGDAFTSWRLPRSVAFAGGDVNLKPGTWLIYEVDGSLALKLGATLGWNMNFSKDLTLNMPAGAVTHDLSAKIDAGLSATFGFSVAGKYLAVVAREGAAPSVRVALYKQKTNGLDFGLNLNIDAQLSDSGLNPTFPGFVQSVFGLQGQQVLSDLTQWSSGGDTGQMIAGLIGDNLNGVGTANQLETDLLNAVGISPADLAAAKTAVNNALTEWGALPTKLNSMLWTFLGQQTSAATAADAKQAMDAFTSFLTDLSDPTKVKSAFTDALASTGFGDSDAGKFLESIAGQGLLALVPTLSDPNNPVTTAANQVLPILNGGLIQKLQAFINQKLDLSQITNAVNDFNNVGQWLQNRLGNFLDKILQPADLAPLQTAIKTLDDNVTKYYAEAVKALTNKYSITFAAAFQQNTTDTALVDAVFDLSQPSALTLFNQIVQDSNFDALFTAPAGATPSEHGVASIPGVTLNTATLSHEISRKGTVDLNMPLFSFSGASANDVVASLTLTPEASGSSLLVYAGTVNGTDTQTIANRASSQLAMLASLTLTGAQPQIDSDSSISYELRQVQTVMQPSDLQTRIAPFVTEYLPGHFGTGASSLASFCTTALTPATRDVALSIQLSLPASALGAWFQQLTPAQLLSAQTNLSWQLQGMWKNLLPLLYFQDPNHYGFNPTTAALLVWAAMPTTTDVGSDPDNIHINKGPGLFWGYGDPQMRKAMASHPLTSQTLLKNLTVLNAQLAGTPQAGFFAPTAKTVSLLIQAAVGNPGDGKLTDLLVTEAGLVKGATDALSQASSGLAALNNSPTKAIALLAQCVANLTEAFNKGVNNSYSGISSGVMGPLLLAQASGVLNRLAPTPTTSALMSLYALNPGHAFNLGSFVTGSNPTKADVASSQTLVNLS